MSRRHPQTPPGQSGVKQVNREAKIVAVFQQPMEGSPRDFICKLLGLRDGQEIFDKKSDLSFFKTCGLAAHSISSMGLVDLQLNHPPPHMEYWTSRGISYRWLLIRCQITPVGLCPGNGARSEETPPDHCMSTTARCRSFRVAIYWCGLELPVNYDEVTCHVLNSILPSARAHTLITGRGNDSAITAQIQALTNAIGVAIFPTPSTPFQPP